MSLQCPLCGKNKATEALFCEDCSKKIRTDYELELPERLNGKTESIVRKQEEKSENEIRNESGRANDHKEIPQEFDSRKRKKGKPFLWFVLVAVILAGAFLVYNETIRKNNLERAAWDKALKINSVEGYLAYMASHPTSARFGEAQTRLMSLKQGEAMDWEMLKTTDNLSALRDFLQQYPESPYRSLVKMRLDSLSWMGALKVNRTEAYSDYMLQVQRGDFKGEYLTLADDRYTMLFQSYPVNEADLDSIRRTVEGFYNSLSSVNYDGISRYLAPVVERFFESGRASRERITGELLVAAARSQDATLQFDVDQSAVQYEKTMEGGYKVNVPIVKLFEKEEATTYMPGYIVHMELNSLFQIIAIYETKPYPGAP